MGNPVQDALAKFAGGLKDKGKLPIGLSGEPEPTKRPKGLSPAEQVIWAQQHQFESPPLYPSGAEDMPGGGGIEEIAQLQSQLVDAGLLDPDNVAWGNWDKYSRNAFRDLLGEANRGKMRWEFALGQRLALAEQGLLGGKGSKREKPPLTVELTNEADIRAGLDQAAPNLLGRKLHDDEVSPFVAQYHDLQRQAAVAKYNQTYNTGGGDAYYGGGGTVTDPPSLDGFIDQQMKTKYKDEYSANTIGQNGLYFLKMIAQGAPDVGLPGVQS